MNGRDMTDPWQCDPVTPSRLGGKLQGYHISLGQEMRLVLVPNLSQCLVDANSLATGQNTVSELQLRVECPLEQA